MQQVGCMVSLNGIDYLPWSLPPLLEVCDRVIVVENSNQWAWDMAGEDGLSVDGTTEYLQSLAQEYPDKFLYLPVGRVQHYAEARNYYMRELQDDDLFIWVDQDEVWFTEELQRGFQLLRDHPGHDAVKVESPLFWGDFRHFVPTSGCSRIIRRSGVSYHEYQDGVTIGDELAPSRNCQAVFPDPPICYLHLGWVRRPLRLFAKCLFSYRYWARTTGCGEIYQYLQGMSDLELSWEIILSNHCFTRILPPGMEQQPYGGPWPPELSSHPFWELSEGEIFERSVGEEILGSLSQGDIPIREWIVEGSINSPDWNHSWKT